MATWKQHTEQAKGRITHIPLLHNAACHVFVAAKNQLPSAAQYVSIQ